MTDPVDTILSRLQGVRRSGAAQWEARCPAHDDRHASLSVSRGREGRALLHCHAGCSPMEVCQALGLPLRSLFPPDSLDRGPGRIVAAYDYRDAEGRLLFQAVRLEPKDFRQRRPDGNGGWLWSLEGTPRVLYRLPELLAADPAGWVFVVEGEKDADNLAALGLVATANPMGAGNWSKLSDDSPLHGRRVAILPDKDVAGRKHARDVAARLAGRAVELKVIELPGDGKDISDWIEAGGTADGLRDLIDSAPAWSDSDVPSRPTILIDTEEHRVVREAVGALAEDAQVFQRGGLLVRVMRDRPPEDGVRRPDGSPTIQALPPANLRERLTRCAAFVKTDRKGQEKPAHPTSWLVSAVDARGDWPGIRYLRGVSDAPVLRPDGSIWQDEGYDPATGVLVEGGAPVPPISPRATTDDAVTARDALLEVICDFQFEAPEHKAAWLAGLLTPLARFAFEGPAPLFLLDANVRGAGKGLLAQTVGRTVLGREMPVSSYARDCEEMRKRITAIAIAGDRLVLLDNLEGAFGNDALDRALTSTRWKDRILGKSQEVELPLMPVWYATGNNVAVAADTARRIIHVRIDVLDEHPEQRSGFRHPRLLEWVTAQRGRLLAAALTILSAYCRAGRPEQGLRPYGSFEGWSDLVRQAVVWAGLPDPCLTRLRLSESADRTTAVLGQLVEAWRGYNGSNGVVVSEMISQLYAPRQSSMFQDEASTTMRAALENLVSTPAGKTPTARQVGNKLRAFRRRVVGGVYLDVDASVYEKRGAVWRLYGARTAARPDSAESDSVRSGMEYGDGGESAESAESRSGPSEMERAGIAESAESTESFSAPCARENRREE